MKKQKQKQSKLVKYHLSKRKIIVGTVAVFAIVPTVYFVASWWMFYKTAADQANIVQIRELIFQASEGLSRPAPIDFRTGDVYFPEAKLYLPRPDMLQTIKYRWDPADSATNSVEMLTITTRPLSATAKLYSAQNVNQLFDAVPQLQACSRGIKVYFTPQTDEQIGSYELKNTLKLDDGRTAYIYSEAACPELDPLIDVAKTLRSY